MSTTIVNFYSDAHYEEVVAETERFLKTVPANATAVHLKAQAHYQLGEYDDCIRLLERALVYLAGRERLEVRLQLAALLANALLEQGNYEEVRELVTHSAPVESSAREEYGELLLASAWASHFLGKHEQARKEVARIFECSGEHFTCGRAALCAALAARAEDDPHRSKAYLMKAQHHLTSAQNLFGNPNQVRSVFLVAAQVARRGASEEIEVLERETARLPQGSRICSLLRDAVDLYRRHLCGESLEAAVVASVGQGVKRTWVAVLPGAGARIDPQAAPAPLVADAGMALAFPHFEPCLPEGMPEVAEGENIVLEIPELENELAPFPTELPCPADAPAPAPLREPPGEITRVMPARRAHRALPARPTEAPTALPPVRTPKDETPPRGIRMPSGIILLVEPVERIALAFESCVRDSSFKVKVRAPDVESALEQYILHRPALVVVDLHAPGATVKGAPGVPSFIRRFLEIDPHCKIAVIYNAQTKESVGEALRQGARAEVEQPFHRSRLLDALIKALASRSVVEAMRVPTLELKRPVACSWKLMESGMRSFMGAWRHFVARALDPMGLEASLDAELKPGTVVRLNIEIPGAAKTIQTLAEVISCKAEPALHCHVTRFSYLKLAPEARDRMVSFLMDSMARMRQAAEKRSLAVS